MDNGQPQYPEWVEKLDSITRSAVKNEFDRYFAVRCALGERPAPDRSDALIGMALRTRPINPVVIARTHSAEERVAQVLIKDASVVTREEVARAKQLAEDAERIAAGSHSAAAAKLAFEMAELVAEAVDAVARGQNDADIRNAKKVVVSAIDLSEKSTEAFRAVREALPNDERVRRDAEAAENASEDANAYLMGAVAQIDMAAAEKANVEARLLHLAQAAEKALFAARESVVAASRVHAVAKSAPTLLAKSA